VCWGRRTALVSVAAVALLGGAGLALAGYDAESDPEGKSNGFDYRSASTEFAGSGAIAAACPDGKRITGGGAGFDGDTSNAELRLIGPDTLSPEVSEKNGFGAQGSIDGLGQTLKTFAICTKAGGLKLKSKAQKTGTPLPGDLVTAKSRCPRGMSVLGGGLKAETTPETLLVSAPYDSGDDGNAPDDGWTIRVENGTGILDIFAVAICSEDLEPAYKAQQSSISTGERTATRECPGDRTVVGGGAALSGDLGASLNASRPVDSADNGTTPDNGWEAIGYVDSGPRFITAYVICV